MWPDLVAALMLLGLVVYALTGGADFGGGVWDLLARGPRAEAQRKLVEQAIAPVWEANHVWLIFVVVLLFSAFPPAFSAFSIALHIPITLMLLGIVLRGSAFVFRQYGGGETVLWQRVFAVASAVTPIFLGILIGALTRGGISVVDGVTSAGWFEHWTSLLPIACGLLTLALFAFLAAVYLTVEASDRALQDDFRRRALAAGLAVAPVALLTALAAAAEAPRFTAAFTGSWWSWPLQLTTGAFAVGALVALVRRAFRWARLLAAAQVTAILVGWALAQHPYLLAPDLTFANAAAPDESLALVSAVIAGGMLVLAPSLYWLFRVFKGTRSQDPRRLQ
jgi:cytochrome bd ubiquinol oxidase subunit II